MKHIDQPLLEVNNLVVAYDAGYNQKIRAVSDVSLKIIKGETLGLVGESGCGKSSLARGVMQLPRPNSGTIKLNSTDLTKLSDRELQRLRPNFQMVFQDSISALNPRRSIGKSIAMPLKITGKLNKSEIHARVEDMLSKVGLKPELFDSKPHQLSGGQCQRVQIARALITSPQLLICDEPVSSLDVSIQAQIINLLENMRKQYKLTLLFISHDLTIVKNISDRIAVMYLGKLCESAPSEALYQACAHPYTKVLLNAIPKPERVKTTPTLETCFNEIQTQTAPPTGCLFKTRCPDKKDICAIEAPKLNEIRPGHRVACHLFP